MKWSINRKLQHQSKDKRSIIVSSEQYVYWTCLDLNSASVPNCLLHSYQKTLVKWLCWWFNSNSTPNQINYQSINTKFCNLKTEELFIHTNWLLAYLTKTSGNHGRTGQISITTLKHSLFMLSMPFPSYIHHTSCIDPVRFCSRLSVRSSPCPACVSYNNRFSTDIIAPAIWSYSGSGVQLLSAVIYRCSISIIQCWLALLACCGPRGFFRANKALLQNTLTLTFS